MNIHFNPAMTWGSRHGTRALTHPQVLEDPQQSLEDLGLRDGDHLTAICREARLTATRAAFALWCPGADGIVTWGSAGCGATSSEVDA